MTVFVIVVLYNRLGFSRQCLGDLLKQTHPLEIIAVDAGSTDGSRSAIPKEFPQIGFIASERELWWAEALSVGISHAHRTAKPGDFILCMNNDVAIPDRQFIEKLLAHSMRNGRALTVPLAWHEENGQRVDDSVGGWILWHQGFVIHSENASPERMRTPMDFLSGRGLLIPVEVIDRIGNFDAANFPQNLSDREFTYRARRAGFPLEVATDAELHHLEATPLATREISFLGYAQAWDMLTGIKSWYNIPRNFRFINLFCPARYRLLAKLQFAAKALTLTLGQTFPLGLIGLPIKWAAFRVTPKGRSPRNV